MHTPLALPAQSGFRSDLRGLSTEIITTLAGIAAAIGVIAFNVFMQRALELDVLGITYAFVLPVGAILGGLGAAAGYYFAARITHTLPTRRMLFEMLAIGFSTWLLMHWVEYATMRFSDGNLVRSSVSFWDYLQLRTAHLRLLIQNGGAPSANTTPELGVLGYLHELLQVTGFLVGGFFIWAALRSHEACEHCSRYARSLKLLQRATTAVFEEVLRRAEVQLPNFADRVRAKTGKHRLVGMSLSIATCSCCRRQWLRPGVVLLQGNHPVAKRLDRYELTSAQAAAIQLAAPAKAA